jgi:hypothetical protein
MWSATTGSATVLVRTMMHIDLFMRTPYPPLRADQSAMGAVNRPLLEGCPLYFVNLHNQLLPVMTRSAKTLPLYRASPNLDSGRDR